MHPEETPILPMSAQRGKNSGNVHIQTYDLNLACPFGNLQVLVRFYRRKLIDEKFNDPLFSLIYT
jgi:hypothetical protein